MNLNPLNDRVVIEPSKADDKTEGGLYLPDDAKEKPQTGKVIAVGEGSYQDGSRVPLTVEVKDTVLFSKYSGIEYKSNGKTYLIIRENDILAIIK